MTATLKQSIASHRAVLRCNLTSAKLAKRNGHRSARRWHVETAASIRGDIRNLKATA